MQERAAVPAVAKKANVAFVEVPYIQPTPKDIESTAPSVAVIRISCMSIEITNDISDTVLAQILRGVFHALFRIRRVVLACRTVDLRKRIDGLAMIIGDKYKQNPFEKGTLFLFCGKCSDRCKGLLWMGTGFLLLNKRFEDGRMA